MPGGFRVSPLEVESVLLQHPDVARGGRAGMAGIRNSLDHRRLRRAAEGATPDEDEVLAFVRDRLAAYKCPKQIWFVTALPRTANGKLIRKALERP